MSEEILRALMQLFAILTKQDGGVEENEKQYVQNFLYQQLGEKDSTEYFQLFEDASSVDERKRTTDDGKTSHKLTSVLDSVRILGICKKINKTLNQSQKVVVLVRLFELVSASRKLTKQRIAIINTASEVFRISADEYNSIETFVLSEKIRKEKDRNILLITEDDNSVEADHFTVERLDREIVILRIPDVDLYFLKYTGDEELFLNGLGIHKNRISHFSKGSTIRLPKGKPVYYSDIVAHFLSDRKENLISFCVEDLYFKFRSGDTGLKNIRFSARQGNLMGILGSSGSGKTTLLNVLSGIERPSSGTVRINGFDLHNSKEELSGVIGFVPQDDLLVEELTVFQNLYYNAKLCFSELDEATICEKVDRMLFSLDLADKKNLKVGSPFNKTISGGQRKRLNIALELIREPSIMFVDEPTSGLSSRDSENVMDLLRELTLKGKLIFAVIHQPSSEVFKMFDDVIILDKGGHMVYTGNPVEAVMYFKRLDGQINSDLGECSVCGNVNPELIFNIIEARVVDEYGNYTNERKVSPKRWTESFHNLVTSREIQEVSEQPPKSLSIPGWIKQFKVYTARDLLSKISNRQYLAVTLLEAPVLAFILSYIIRYIVDPSSDRYIFRENENIPVYIFMAIIVSLFLGLTVSAEEIFRDRKMLKREKFLHLSRSGYLMSKIGILTIISAIQTLCFVLIANNIIELKGMTLHYWFALFTTAVCANLLGLNISASFNSAITIYIVIPLLMIPMMILSGAMFSFEKLNRNISRVDKVPIIAEIMPAKWAYEALMVRQFKDNKFQMSFYNVDKRITNADFQLSYYIPELEERLDRCLADLRANDVLTTTMNDFKIIVNEIMRESRISGIPLTLTEEETDPGSFSYPVTEKIKGFLSELNSYYLRIFTVANTEKTNRINYLLNNKRDLYFSLLNKYHNESVSDIVRKIYEKNKIVVYKSNLVRQIEPVFFDPVPDGYIGIRSHFFAPRKYFMGKYYDTYWFNMSAIWVLTGLLYIALYFSLLKKIVGT